MRSSTVRLPYFMVPAVAGAVLVGVLIGCGSGRDELIISGGQGGSEADAQPDVSQGGQSGGAGMGGSGGTGGGGVVEGPSCNGLAKNCGAEGNTSCCSSLLVPGGSFPMGRSESETDACPSGMTCDLNEQPEHNVTVSDFYLDEFEVTVGRFRKFVEAYDKSALINSMKSEERGKHPKISGSGWQAGWDSELPGAAVDLKSNLKCNSVFQTWQDVGLTAEQHPINCVNWYEAFAFCAWDGGRLPTEAEWERAAAGGEENRLYPWELAAPDGTRAAFACLYYGNSDCTFADIAKVGSFPAGAGRWGHKDLAGNMREWVLDWYDADWYGGEGRTCTNCAQVNDKNGFLLSRVLRGGAFSEEAKHLRAVRRFDVRNPLERGYGRGFRCARDK